MDHANSARSTPWKCHEHKALGLIGSKKNLDLWIPFKTSAHFQRQQPN